MSAFFLQHKELFEFDKFVGGGQVTSSAVSFLDRYRECERQQAADVAQYAASNVTIRLDSVAFMPTDLMIPSLLDTSAYSAPLSAPTFGFAAFPPTSTFPNHESSFSPRRSTDDTYPRSPNNRASLPQSVGFIAEHQHHPCSPKRAAHASEITRGGIPKLSELLVDGSTRASLSTSSKRVDDAKKIELLIGSKCVGRISAAASSNLPPAIRRRLEASNTIHQRRERLYTVLRDDYMRITS